MEELREKLHKAIEKYGIGDERTIELSQLRDEEIVLLQRKKYEKWIINQGV